ncbi:MAG: peptidoglycan DD-metalloendopeptidase family protein [Rhodospirillales bacterium]|nr:peptidoglycan DD-metalloendopeptidase family protein [Rhodospirillales bacterium]
MSPPRLSKRPASGRVIVPWALTLAAALTCFGGSLGAVLDPQPTDGGDSAFAAGTRETAQNAAYARSPDKSAYEPILVALASPAGAQPRPEAPGTTAAPPGGGAAPPSIAAKASGRADPVAGPGSDAGRVSAPGSEESSEDSEDALPAAVAGIEERLITIERGDTLSGALHAAGVPTPDAQAALDALRPVFDPRNLRVGEAVTVAVAAAADEEAQGRLIKLAVALDSRRRAVVTRGADDGFTVSIQDLATVRTPVRADGVIASSLYAAAARAGVPDAIVSEMIRAFSYEIDFQRDLRSGDRFSVMYEQVGGADGAVLDAGALIYASMSVDGEEHILYRHVGSDGAADYYGPDGSGVRTALLRTPVNGARLSSGYGMRRHPVLGYSRMHRGIDFAAPIGTPVYAAGAGHISAIGRNRGYGNYIQIEHRGGYATAYGHLSRFAAGLQRGSAVKQGEVIGYVGNTGLSTGAHLHYEILVNGQQVDPLDVKGVREAHLDDDEMAKFALTKAAIDRRYAQLGSPGPVASVAARDR